MMCMSLDGVLVAAYINVICYVSRVSEHTETLLCVYDKKREAKKKVKSRDPRLTTDIVA